MLKTTEKKNEEKKRFKKNRNEKKVPRKLIQLKNERIDQGLNFKVKLT